MATVVADMSVSLDGFVADPSHGVEACSPGTASRSPSRPLAGRALAVSA